MPSGAMICMTADRLRYLAPICQNAFIENFSSRLVAFKDINIFHLTLANNRTSNKYIKAILHSLVLLWSWGSSPCFFVDRYLRIFEFKQAELKGYVENTVPDPNIIFCLTEGKVKQRLICYFFAGWITAWLADWRWFWDNWNNKQTWMEGLENNIFLDLVKRCLNIWMADHLKNRSALWLKNWAGPEGTDQPTAADRTQGFLWHPLIRATVFYL